MGNIGLLTLVVALLIYLTPIVIIARSDKTQGTEKIIWLFAVVFVSWFACLLYWLVAPVSGVRKPHVH
ncbi:hypothetical protein [Paraferrimonas sedimenticola]|uniref:Cardiolipin synthase N-terminal domain-containing protein n=1 Tax=Paraferrimonas sedimenticola TaxID=375674 RepID=A0AA37RTZ5_9GAMM|nr:hypothetical protein [Paraferrimonas sedimenticola]GLP94739.1 hypothetical protein GCM10007895_00450 [Paraferrimonas sedimenticola]